MSAIEAYRRLMKCLPVEIDFVSNVHEPPLSVLVDNPDCPVAGLGRFFVASTT
jgi:hypothetical protein